MTLDIHEALLLLRQKGSVQRSVGICKNLQIRLGTPTRPPGLYPLFEQWPEFSGDIEYPVPSGDPWGTYLRCEDKWDRGTKYGQARWRLLDFLIEKTAP